MTVSAVRIHPDDNVACLLCDHDAGERPILAQGDVPPPAGPVPMGHKVALGSIAEGAPVVKFGAVVGHATRAIAPGEHVHLHNLEGASP